MGGSAEGLGVSLVLVSDECEIWLTDMACSVVFFVLACDVFVFHLRARIVNRRVAISR